jgi:hypothetical protein
MPPMSRVRSQRSISRMAGVSAPRFSSRLRSSEERPDFHQQIVRQTGLHEKSIAPCGYGHLLVRRESPPCERDYRHTRSVFLAFQLADKLEAAHARQYEIDNRCVRRQFNCQAVRIERITRLKRTKS